MGWVVVLWSMELRSISSHSGKTLDVEKCGFEDTKSKHQNGKCDRRDG